MSSPGVTAETLPIYVRIEEFDPMTSEGRWRAYVYFPRCSNSSNMMSPVFSFRSKGTPPSSFMFGPML